MKQLFILLCFFYFGYVQSQTNEELLSLPQLNNHKSFAASLRFKTDFKDYAADYLYSYEKDKTYDQYKNDEFEFNSKLKIATQSISNIVDAIKKDSFFVIVSSADFGEYDFDKNYFNFKPIKYGTYYDLKELDYRGCDKCKITTTISLDFVNASKFNNIYINPEEANRLIKSRKDSYGSIDRNVNFFIVYKLLDKMEENIKDRIRDVKLHGSIKYIMVINYNRFKKGDALQIYKMIEDK